MSGGAAYSAVMAVLLCTLVVVGYVLLRYRDRLQRVFGPPQKGLRSYVDVAPGARLAIVEIDGLKIVCALGKTGITALQIIEQETKA